MADDASAARATADVAALDHVFLHGVTAVGWHGLFDSERRLGQRFVVDVDWWLNCAGAIAGDEIEETVCYKRVFDRVQLMITGTPYQLIETLAEELASKLLEDFPRIERLTVTVHKPQAPLGGEFLDVGVTVKTTRTKLREIC